MNHTGFVDEKYIKVIVESAGRTLTMLPNTGAWPAGYRSCWPEYIREWGDLIEAPKEFNPQRIRPTVAQMNELETVEDWIVGLANHCRRRHRTEISRCVAAAMLHHPFIEGRRIYSFRKLGNMFGTSNHTVKKWYMEGLHIIANNVNLEQSANDTKPHFLTA
ncbi:MAG: hypothetical protein JKY93_01055 [Gammaproteobacteria bacterium]|nr:hypothetical protein [Gammaproteobacteria bacterium]